ncbi:hypothetical protein NDU88_002873, partial [Pleurodeles waltl]
RKRSFSWRAVDRLHRIQDAACTLELSVHEAGSTAGGRTETEDGPGGQSIV